MAHERHPYRQGLLSFLTINFLCGSATGILQLAIPLYALSLKATTVQLGLISGVSGVGRMLIIVPSGLVVDRCGARRLFVASTGACVCLVGVMQIVTSPWTLMAVMFFQGMAQSVSFLALQAGFLKRLPFLEPTQAGWQRGATQLGYYLVGPVAGGLLLQNSRYGETFLLVCGAFILSLGFSFYRRLTGIHEVADAVVPDDAGDLRKLRVLLSDPLLLQVLGIECVGAAIFMLFRTFVAPVAVEVLHLPVSAVSIIIIFQGTCAMASMLGGGKLVNRYSASRLFAGASLLVVSGMLLLANANGFFLYVTGSVVYGFGTGLLSLCSLSRLVDVAGEKGKIAALFSLSIAVGNIFGPMFGGLVGEVLTVQAVFYAPVLMLAAILVALAARSSGMKRSVAGEVAGD